MKRKWQENEKDDETSPLTRGRGLKHDYKAQVEAILVAPYAGAWIETSRWRGGETMLFRRPLRGGVD